MIKLMGQELNRVSLRAYLTASLLLGGFVLVFTYFVAGVAQVVQEPDFLNYGNIYRFSCVIGMVLFGGLSASVSNRLIIRAYPGCKKVFWARTALLLLSALLSTLLCVGVPLGVFSATEAIFPIVSDTLTSELLADALLTLIFSALSVGAVSLLATGIGLMKRSSSATLVGALLLACVYGNVAVYAGGSAATLFSVVGASLTAAAAVLLLLAGRADRGEAE